MAKTLCQFVAWESLHATQKGRPFAYKRILFFFSSSVQYGVYCGSSPQAALEVQLQTNSMQSARHIVSKLMGMEAGHGETFVAKLGFSSQLLSKMLGQPAGRSLAAFARSPPWCTWNSLHFFATFWCFHHFSPRSWQTRGPHARDLLDHLKSEEPKASLEDSQVGAVRERNRGEL